MASVSRCDNNSIDLSSETQVMLGIEKIHSYGEEPKNTWNSIGRLSSQLKWPLMLLLQFIMLLRFYDPNQCPVEAGQDPNRIAPTLGRELRGFSEQLEQYTPNYTSEASTLEIRGRWEMLFPRGGGLVSVDHPGEYDYLGEPIQPAKEGEFGALFMVSWVHQLHCLYFVMNAYDLVLQRGASGLETQIPEGHFSVHSRHCFDYLKQTIMCNLDMTLEGAKSNAPAGTDGMGQTHVCRNYDQAKDWIESRRPWDSRDFIDLHETGEV